MMYGGGEIGNNDNNSSSGIGGENVYRDNEEELVLVSLFDLYSELEAISVSASGPSSYPILHCLLTTSTTDYCLKENVNDFGLRRPFYSRQGFKNTCHSLV